MGPVTAAPRASGGPVAPVVAVRRLLPILGPAFVASVAYVDPGNFATNMAGGATFGYTLVWVVVLANVVAMLVQYLAAKLGIATGSDLAQLCRVHLPPGARWFMWGQGELVAMATDLAEFVGAAVALWLLFDIPPLAAGGITAVIAYLILTLRRFGRRPFEIAIVAFLGVIALVFAYEVVLAAPSASEVAGGLIPRFAGTESVLLASGIVGATVMPHAIYVHSSMTSTLGRAADGVPERQRLLKAQRFDVVIALGTAGLVNVSMLTVAAALFHSRGIEVDGLDGAHAALAVTAGAGAAMAFAIALLASGLSSASVGTNAGEVIMQGFLGRRISPFVRRSITMLPALVLLGSGADLGMALVLSQVVLSFGIPFTLIPLVLFTARRTIMNELVNRRSTTVLATLVVVAISGLNVFLIAQVLTGGA